MTRFFRTALDIFNATVSVVISPQDISWQAATQYKSIHQDLLLLEAPDFEGVGFDLRLGVGGKILPDTLTVEPAGNAKNDLPGGICEI